MKDFDKIIMNPPYDRSLHLKILRQVMNKADEVVNLSPIRWLQDPLAEIKGNRADYGRFADIRSKITSLEVVDGKEAQSIFGALIGTDLGIYYLTPEGGWKPSFEKRWMNEKILMPTFNGENVMKHWTPRGKGDFDRPFVKLSELHGHVGQADFYDYCSPDYSVAKKKGGSCAHTVNFDTEEECKNFFDTLHTKLFKAISRQIKMNMYVPWNYVPYLPTYTHPWTDEMLYEYFGLTDDEIQEIEQVV